MEVVKMRKIIFSLIVTCFVTVFCACDVGLRIVGMEVEHYPDKLFYVIGVDDSLDLEGGAIRRLNKAGNTQILTMDEVRTAHTLEPTVRHDIDFTKEGIYVVQLRWADFSVSFPVQVVSLETLERIVAGVEED
jgi:hypothetical protein